MRRHLCIIVFCLIGLLTAKSALAASPPFGGKGIPVKGFKVAEPFGPPYETQTKSLLEGGKALVWPNGSATLSEGVLLHTYNETNTPQIIVRADECFYDSSNRVITSAGPIHMQTADGRFTIGGVGFFLQQSNNSLVISNKVHTVIHQASMQSGLTNRTVSTSQGEDAPLVIDSTSFSYDGSSGRGVWLEKVQVTGTNLLVNSEVLTATVVEQRKDQRQLRTLEAEREVTVDYTNYGGLHATGGRMIYAPDTGVIRILDRATWQAQQREGRGDELVIDRTNHIFQVNRHAWLKMAGLAMSDAGFLSVSNTLKSQASAKSSVEVSCDSYEIRTNWGVFRDEVRLEEHVGDTLRGWLTCKDQMTVTFGGTNELQTLMANKDVVIEEQTNRLAGGRAFYTHTNSILEMTQNPTWRSKEHWGKGDRIRLNTQRNEMMVSGNASMWLPAHELAGQLTPGSLHTTTNRPPRIGTNDFAQIFCEEYVLRNDHSVFKGGVYATHPEMNWWCERLIVEVPSPGLTNIIAEQNVVFDVTSPYGPIHGTGDNAIYSFGTYNTRTNGTLPLNQLQLTGTPAVLTNAVKGAFRNPVVVWDRAKDKISLPGSEYKIEGFAKIDTNTFVLPNKKRTK